MKYQTLRTQVNPSDDCTTTWNGTFFCSTTAKLKRYGKLIKPAAVRIFIYRTDEMN